MLLPTLTYLACHASQQSMTNELIMSGDIALYKKVAQKEKQAAQPLGVRATLMYDIKFYINLVLKKNFYGICLHQIFFYSNVLNTNLM